MDRSHKSLFSSLSVESCYANKLLPTHMQAAYSKVLAIIILQNKQQRCDAELSLGQLVVAAGRSLGDVVNRASPPQG